MKDEDEDQEAYEEKVSPSTSSSIRDAKKNFYESLLIAENYVTAAVDAVCTEARRYSQEAFVRILQENEPICAIPSELYENARNAMDLVVEFYNEIKVRQNVFVFTAEPITQKEVYINRNLLKELVNLQELLAEISYNLKKRKTNELARTTIFRSEHKFNLSHYLVERSRLQSFQSINDSLEIARSKLDFTTNYEDLAINEGDYVPKTSSKMVVNISFNKEDAEKKKKLVDEEKEEVVEVVGREKIELVEGVLRVRRLSKGKVLRVKQSTKTRCECGPSSEPDGQGTQISHLSKKTDDNFKSGESTKTNQIGKSCDICEPKFPKSGSKSDDRIRKRVSINPTPSVVIDDKFDHENKISNEAEIEEENSKTLIYSRDSQDSIDVNPGDDGSESRDEIYLKGDTYSGDDIDSDRRDNVESADEIHSQDGIDAEHNLDTKYDEGATDGRDVKDTRCSKLTLDPAANRDLEEMAEATDIHDDIEYLEEEIEGEDEENPTKNPKGGDLIGGTDPRYDLDPIDDTRDIKYARSLSKHSKSSHSTTPRNSVSREHFQNRNDDQDDTDSKGIRDAKIIQDPVDVGDPRDVRNSRSDKDTSDIKDTRIITDPRNLTDSSNIKESSDGKKASDHNTKAVSRHKSKYRAKNRNARNYSCCHKRKTKDTRLPEDAFYWKYERSDPRSATDVRKPGSTDGKKSLTDLADRKGPRDDSSRVYVRTSKGTPKVTSKDDIKDTRVSTVSKKTPSLSSDKKDIQNSKQMDLNGDQLDSSDSSLSSKLGSTSSTSTTLSSSELSTVVTVDSSIEDTESGVRKSKTEKLNAALPMARSNSLITREMMGSLFQGVKIEEHARERKKGSFKDEAEKFKIGRAKAKQGSRRNDVGEYDNKTLADIAEAAILKNRKEKMLKDAFKKKIYHEEIERTLIKKDDRFELETFQKREKDDHQTKTGFGSSLRNALKRFTRKKNPVPVQIRPYKNCQCRRKCTKEEASGGSEIHVCKDTATQPDTSKTELDEYVRKEVVSGVKTPRKQLRVYKHDQHIDSSIWSTFKEGPLQASVQKTRKGELQSEKKRMHEDPSTRIVKKRNKQNFSYKKICKWKNKIFGYRMKKKVRSKPRTRQNQFDKNKGDELKEIVKPAAKLTQSDVSLERRIGPTDDIFSDDVSDVDLNLVISDVSQVLLKNVDVEGADANENELKAAYKEWKKHRVRGKKGEKLKKRDGSVKIETLNKLSDSHTSLQALEDLRRRKVSFRYKSEMEKRQSLNARMTQLFNKIEHRSMVNLEPKMTDAEVKSVLQKDFLIIRKQRLIQGFKRIQESSAIGSFTVVKLKTDIDIENANKATVFVPRLANVLPETLETDVKRLEKKCEALCAHLNCPKKMYNNKCVCTECVSLNSTSTSTGKLL